MMESGETENTFLDGGDISVSIYPNPNMGRFSVSMDGMNGKDYCITIFNKLGKEISILNARSEKGKVTETVNLSGFSSGLYFVSLRIGEHKIVKKAIVTK